MKTRPSAFGALVMALSIAVGACAPSGAGAPSGSAGRVLRDRGRERGGSSGDGVHAPVNTGDATTDKTLIIGLANEVKGFSTISGRQNKYVEDLIQGNLFLQADDGRWFPALVERMPSVENGDWKLYDDGTSETIYRLKKAVKWHDGVEFTAHDLVFSRKIIMDRELPVDGRSQQSRMSSVDALDDHTLRVMWHAWEAEADTLDLRWFWPMPRHILEPVYEADKQLFINHPFWSTEFIGLGPYKVVKFDHGSHMELTANDDYVLGTPRIKNIVIRFYQDSNLLIAALEAGAVHMTLHGSRAEGGLGMSDGILLGTRWNASGEGKVIFHTYWVQLAALQMNPEFQRPLALGDVRVRRALLHAFDRQTLVDQMFGGFTEVAHGWLPTNDMDFRTIESAITRYAFDPPRAQRLLAEAGLQRAGDGSLVNARGERFELEYRAGGRDAEGIAAAAADNWKALGVDTQLVFLSTARARDSEWMAKFPGIRNHTMTADTSGGAINRYSCTTAPGPENDWLFFSSNASGYCNAEMEQHWAAAGLAFPYSAKLGPVTEMMRIALRDLPYMPLYFEHEPVAVRSGVIGVDHIPPKIRGRIGMHSYRWDLR